MWGELMLLALFTELIEWFLLCRLFETPLAFETFKFEDERYPIFVECIAV